LGHTQFHIGDNGTGVANFSGTAIFSNAQNTDVGTGETGIGTLNVSGSASYTTEESINLGNNGTGTLNISGNGVVNCLQMNVANATGTGIVNQTGGTVNANNWVALGQGVPGALPVYNQSGGTLNVGVTNPDEFMTVGEDAEGTFNASGTAVINAPGILVGRNGDGTIFGDGLLEITGSSVSITLAGDLRLGLQEASIDEGASGELSFIADAGGISTIVAGDNTEFGATGTQTLTVDLTAAAGFPELGMVVLVDNAAPVAGTFTGLAEGASVSIGGGETASISYVGGDGNDIVLSVGDVADVIKGDVDLSGVVDFGDIAPFIAVLQNGGSQAEADVDCDGSVGFEDIAPFIAILQGN